MYKLVLEFLFTRIIIKYMKQQTQFSYMLKIFSSSIEILEKKKIKVCDLKTHVKNVKFKMLYNISENSVTNLCKADINNRELLKILYLINFEKNFEHHSLNRANLNLLNVLKERIDKFTYDIWSNSSTFKYLYNQTFSIHILYKIYKIHNRR